MAELVRMAKDRSAYQHFIYPFAQAYACQASMVSCLIDPCTNGTVVICMMVKIFLLVARHEIS